MSPGIGVRVADREVRQNVVWVIDGEQWPRALLRAELIERGFDAVGYLTVRDAIDALPMRRPDVIVVEMRGQVSRLVARLPMIGAPVIVIAGAGEIADLPEVGFDTVMRRPVSIGEIADAVQKHCR